MTKLDEIAVNVELVLISLIEGVALVTLAEQTIRALDEPDWYRYIPYMLGGLAILLVYWAQSIMHAISFIRWPIRVEHMFLYFVSAFIQILAYTNITNASGWFFWWSVFSLVTIGMYFLDLHIIKDSYGSFGKIKGGTEFLKKVEVRHIFEMKFLVPIAFVLNALFLAFTLALPGLLENLWIYLILGTIPFLFSCAALYDCTVNFRKRSEMVAALFSERGEGART